MAADERNFRSAYYEKVGFRSVEEKKSLEILLKDKPLDKLKLKQFCLRFTVPGVYRNLLWKILLDVIPIYVDSHKFVILQREQEYNDLLQALKVMRIVDYQSSKGHIFYAMWSLECGKLHYDFNVNNENEFTKISNTLIQIFDNDVDVYWLSKGFYNFVKQFHRDIPRLIQRTLNLFEKEDNELYKHLWSINALKNLPFEKWFNCCFSNIIHESALAKVWDKLCGGTIKILVFVAIVLLTTMRRILLKCTDSTEVLHCINNVTEESSELIVNKAIELWQQHGGALTLQPDSLNPKTK